VERGILVTTNLAFSEWPKVLGGDEKLTTALLDRLAHHAVVITTRGKSFRLRKREQPKQEASTKLAKLG
jgi:DNA replication protein DnaC